MDKYAESKKKYAQSRIRYNRSAKGRATRRRWRLSKRGRNYHNNYYRRNRARLLATNKRSVLKKKYGLTIKAFNELFQRQQGRCAICEKHQSELKKPLAVDHNHKTGEIRGLLCTKCNVTLGNLYADDGLELIHKVIKYLNG